MNEGFVEKRTDHIHRQVHRQSLRSTVASAASIEKPPAKARQQPRRPLPWLEALPRPVDEAVEGGLTKSIRRRFRSLNRCASLSRSRRQNSGPRSRKLDGRGRSRASTISPRVPSVASSSPHVPPYPWPAPAGSRLRPGRADWGHANFTRKAQCFRVVTRNCAQVHR